MAKKVKITVCYIRETRECYTEGQQLILACWRNGHNAGLWTLLPVGTTTDQAIASAREWATQNGYIIVREDIYRR